MTNKDYILANNEKSELAGINTSNRRKSADNKYVILLPQDVNGLSDYDIEKKIDGSVRTLKQLKEYLNNNKDW